MALEKRLTKLENLLRSINARLVSFASHTHLLAAGATDVTASAANVNDAVTKKHTQNTDTALGSGCEAADHGAAATDQVVNVCYGTGDPPAANTTTEGTIYIKYTA